MGALSAPDAVGPPAVAARGGDELHGVALRQLPLPHHALHILHRHLVVPVLVQPPKELPPCTACPVAAALTVLAALNLVCGSDDMEECCSAQSTRDFAMAAFLKAPLLICVSRWHAECWVRLIGHL